MPLKDSMQSEAERRDRETFRQDLQQNEDIETPIEAGVQERAEREFETERKIPASCKKAIVSVDGKDVEQLPIEHHHAA